MGFDRDSKILITGANGFIGSKLVEFVQNKSQVFSLVRNKHNNNVGSKIITADISEDHLELPDEKFDVVYHLASLTPHEKNKEKLKQVNYQGTKNLFEAVKEKAKKIVYVSGLTVFDSKFEQINENTPINPDTNYTKLRVMAQRYLEEHCKENKIQYVTAHVGDIVYGNGGFFMSDMVSRLKRNRFRIPGDGLYFKNYIHVDDVAGALMAIGENSTSSKSFIVTSSNPAPFKEFVYCITSQIGIKNPGTIPEFLAKIAIGKDIVNLLTRSAKASNHKINQIYEFKYPRYQDGIREVFSNNDLG